MSVWRGTDNASHRGILSANEFSDGDLARLHSADDRAVTWLQKVAVKAFAK